MPILKLPPAVVNKIAAGEVIERPASVVKELVENSLDAGATRIEVSVEQGGVDLIRVADDGGGIARDELPLAVAPHATSKLRDADDLFRVGTLGFRGEALASIAEISRFSLRSRRPGGDEGWELEVVGGTAADVVPCGMSPGTTIEVRHLFYNTPVRRKFLRSAQTEMGHVTEAFTRLALAYPEVAFALRHNDRTTYDLPAGQSVVERIALFFGDELARELLPIESVDGAVRLAGFAARPSQSRSHPRMQYLFLNGRFIRDRSLQHALGEAYRGLLLTGRYPIAFLRLDMPAEAVDVNVHPTKLEVRFQDGGRIYGQLLAALRTKFLATDLTHKLQPEGAVTPGDDASAHDPEQTARVRREFVQWAKGGGAPWEADDAAMTTATPAAPLTMHKVAPFRPFADFGAAVAKSQAVSLSPAATSQSSEPSLAVSRADAEASHVRAIQIHNRYLIAESDEGVLVIDQHALHERILYEQLRVKVTSGALESQNLLVPEPVDLPPAEAAALLGRRDVLERLGIRVEPFGGGTVLVSGYPAMLANLPPAEILRSVVDQLLVDGKTVEPRDLVDELLHMVACKAAVKAGDRLTPEEVSALVADRHLVHDTHHCPHGRPTALVFTREELDKQFKRT